MGAQQCGVAELDFDFRVSLYLERTQHDTDCCRSQETNGILGSRNQNSPCLGSMYRVPRCFFAANSICRGHVERSRSWLCDKISTITDFVSYP
uniref:Uncharacterized protein n=1 Tax=Populus trichocarpa TaxID=3694 RepID=A0A2K1YK96_POPTR